MKKLTTQPDYKSQHISNLLSSFRKKNQRQKLLTRRKKFTGSIRNPLYLDPSKKEIKDILYAPTDFRLLDNPEQCLMFFRQLRSDEYLSRRGYQKYILMSLEDVLKIDYATISILTAISDDLWFKKIVLHGDFPENPECKKFMVDSGFLNNMVDANGKKFKTAKKSELIFFEKGCGVLSTDQNRKISALVKNIVNHLIGKHAYFLPVKTIILEICGNSIEWAGTGNKQWLLGVQYLPDRVILTVTDVGKGILDTLNRKFSKTILDSLSFKSPHLILNGAFDKKYGSSTGEVNRNKGLPSVKANFLNKTITYLKVITNNVILHFDDPSKSYTISKGSARFKGTFYQWEMTQDCLLNINQHADNQHS